MATKDPRQPRADARANRERLLQIATRAFAREGPGTSLKGIAKEAGVGIGTLYRHFPTREALIEAAHASELARVCDSADEVLATMPADEALRLWLGRWVDYLTAKHGLARALRATAATDTNTVTFPGARARALDAVSRLLDAGVRDGVLRQGVEPLDVLVAAHGAAIAALDSDQAGRLLNYLLDALRTGRPAGTESIGALSPAGPASNETIEQAAEDA
ncbi:TetR/AcrR family transcriptional regulator [Nonomuraea sp. NEAU-A123]|uniref:TetR/AcrR family transcriptional regulator n=1 Tax=Nonomuraea sp. NEAU-A123 TaxID=2839649 RepID=UPI001BE3F6B8|nr:TetR/AcrR family transcriptional regulator [Nonomuraea sp. NEAU-A123]MBT2232675.1 TetR/AcrR family transcriptional regulator [Nonomuraea sp. NEAU-A123]